jgi:hypothetical protein
MDGPYRDRWLILAAVLYPFLSFREVFLDPCGLGVLAVDPYTIPIRAVAAVAWVIVLRVAGLRLRWASVAAFAAWVALVAYVQLYLFGVDAASV